VYSLKFLNYGDKVKGYRTKWYSFYTGLLHSAFSA
jgi:hypothetical protein